MGRDQTRKSGELSGGLSRTKRSKVHLFTTEYLTSLEQEIDSMTKM